MKKITYFFVTPEASQQLILDEINSLNKELNRIRQECEDQESIMTNRDTSEAMAVLEALEDEEAGFEQDLSSAEGRHYRLMGFYSDGIPF